MDFERLKSIISQIEEGLPTSSQYLKSTSNEGSTSIGGGLFNFLKVEGSSAYIWQNQEINTQYLHDNIYTKVEDALIKNNLLTRIPEDFLQESKEIDQLRNTLIETSFILICGKIIINDFNRMGMILENYNEIGEFISNCSISSLSHEVPKKIKGQKIVALKKSMTLDSKYVKGLKKFIDVFYKDRLIVKIFPIESVPDFRFAGNLTKPFLREDISSIIYKYGTAPASDWTIFAQLSFIPYANRESTSPEIHGNPIDVAFQGIFDSIRNVELGTQSVVYPEIAITPIAIYRYTGVKAF
jgi:hypothetical protein